MNRGIVRLLFLLEYYPIGLIRISNLSTWVLFQNILRRDDFFEFDFKMLV